MKADLRGVGHLPLAERIQKARHFEDRIEHADLSILCALHDEFGFGADRLRRFYHAVVRAATRYNKYNGTDDNYGKRNKRMDVYMMKNRLKEIGFDYDEEAKADEKYDGD